MLCPCYGTGNPGSKGQGSCTVRAGQGPGWRPFSPPGFFPLRQSLHLSQLGLQRHDCGQDIDPTCRSKVGMRGRKCLTTQCHKGMCPGGCTVREDMQGWGCLEGQVGLVPEARGIPAPGSQGKSGDTQEPSACLWDQMCHVLPMALSPRGSGMQPAQAPLGTRQGWPDW